MFDFLNIFYFHATLNKQGIIFDIGGKGIEESEINLTNLIGNNFAEIIFWQHKENISANIANSIKVAAEGNPIEIETTFRNSASKISTLKAKFTPIFNSLNEVEKIIFSSIDVTEYIQESQFYKQRSERYLYAAESAGVGLWFWNFKSGEIFTTPRCNEIFGYSSDEIMTFEKISQVFHPEDFSKIQAALQESQNNLTEYNLEYRIVKSDVGICWVSVQGKTFVDDENTHLMMGSVRDIDHRKQSEERVRQLFAAEKAARDAVDEANREKDHFLAVVSHELRSPLNSILGWSKILLGQNVDEKTRKNALETIENSAKLQAKLIGDLVDSAKIISGKMNLTFRPVSLNKLVESVYLSQLPLAVEKKINFSLGNLSPAPITGDASSLQQVITNLITNAIKFTPPNGSIFIELTELSNFVVFQITDTGCGIPPKDLPSIFKQYYQSENTKNKMGLGLGLSIVKAILEKHKGSVSVKNNDNGIGCTFLVGFPIAADYLAKTKSAKTIENTPRSLENIKILIVEDNDDSRFVLNYYLSELGATVSSVNSAKDGVEYLVSAETLPDVIISDINMPDEDGYSFLRKVRKIPTERVNRIPAIALTALASSNDTQKIMESGFQKHHTKPFEPNGLISDIIEVIENRAVVLR